MATKTAVDGIKTLPARSVPNGGTPNTMADVENDFACLRGVMIQASRSNTGFVYVGDSDIAIGAGISLDAGNTLFVACSGPEKIYVVGDADGQLVTGICL